jgi:hypothetical protein
MTKERQDCCLDEGMRGFIYNTAKENFWRVASWYEFEDLVQDGYVCYYKCYNAYYAAMTKDHQKQMMALVATAFNNHIHTLAAKYQPAGYETPISHMADEGASEASVWDRIVPADAELGTLSAKLANAPAEIKQLVSLLAADVIRGTRKVGRRALRETNNELFCRLLGKNPKEVDMVAQFKEYFA